MTAGLMAPQAPQRRTLTALDKPPEANLAAMLRMQLGVQVEPERLRTFLLANWKRVSDLAHQVHERG